MEESLGEEEVTVMEPIREDPVTLVRPSAGHVGEGF